MILHISKWTVVWLMLSSAGTVMLVWRMYRMGQRRTAELYYRFVRDYPNMGPIRSHVVYTHIQNRVQNDLDVTYTSVIDEMKKKYPTWHW